MSEKVKVHTTHDINERKKRKYKQGEFQAIWDYLDELKGITEQDKEEILRLKTENTRLKKKLEDRTELLGDLQ